METNQTQPVLPDVQMSSDEMLKEIYENTRKTKNYMKWQLYITIVLVVLPIIAATFLIPIALSSLSSTYGTMLNLQ
jgi:predicted nucleic acid-binding Zn ribbon protein